MSSRDAAVTTKRPAFDAVRVAALVQHAPALLGLFDGEDDTVFLSPAGVRALTGEDDGALLERGEHRTVRIHPDDLERVMRAYAETKERPGEHIEFAARTLHSNGTWRHVEGTFINLLHDPEVRGILLSVNDVTSRVAAETELRERLAMEATLSEIARELMRGVTAADAVVESALSRIAQLLGAKRGSVFVLQGDAFVRTVGWNLPDIEPALDRVPLDTLASLWNEMCSGRAVTLDPRAHLGPHTAEGAAVASAVIAAGLVAHERPLGFVTFASDDPEHSWSDSAVSCVQQFAALLTTAIERREAEELQRRSEEALRTSSERFRRLVHASPDVVIVLDADARITFANSSASSIFGYEPEELLGTSAFDLVHPDDLPRAVDAFGRAITNFQSEFVPLRIRHKDGTWIEAETLGSSLLDDPVVHGLLINVRDVRDRNRIAAELREVAVRFQQAWDHSPTGMAFATRDGTFLKVNRSFSEMLGRSQRELLRASMPSLTHPDDLARNVALHRALFEGEIDDYSLEKRFLRKDGTWLWVRSTVTMVRDCHGSPLYSLGQVQDITERREFEERLAYEATHDALTGLPLRKLLIDHLQLAIAGAVRGGGHVGVLFIDLDNFKQANDSLGHAAGDELLVAVAERLRTAVRAVDTPGRFGGDEFVVVCPALGEPEDAVRVAERIRALLARPFSVRGMEMFVGASIGIVIAQADSDASTLLRQADTAAYRAKERGRNRYEIYDDELRAAVESRHETERALRRALDAGELRVLYQPVVSVANGAVVGFEALVRWEQPDGQLLAPAEFLAIAEQTGLIVPLGAHVLRTACTQLTEWEDMSPEDPPFLAVNLSARQLLSPELVDDVRAVIGTAGIDARNLWFEIPETLLVHDTPQLVALLKELGDLGVHLGLDDFGTGYSSLMHLRFLPIDVIKIDRSFIAELGRAPEGATIVESVVGLAHALGMRAVAEGVESSQQLAMLRHLGCDWVQGFYFSQPLDAARATQVLARGRLYGRTVSPGRAASSRP